MVLRSSPLQMYKNSQLSLENINADKDIKNKVKEAVWCNVKCFKKYEKTFFFFQHDFCFHVLGVSIIFYRDQG